MKKKTKLLIALLLVFVGVGLTYAVYTTSVGGNANVTAANWVIKVKTGSDFDNQAGIDVSNGATDINLGSCQKLAPGGSCTLPFRVDATSTEVDTILTVALGSNVSGATLGELEAAGISLRISDGVNEDYAYLLNMGSYKDLNLVINWEAGDEDDDDKAAADVNIAENIDSITLPVNMIVKQRAGGIRTVTFNTHDENVTTPEPIQVNDGDSILEANIPVPVKSGYMFDGWYTSEVGGIKLTPSTIIIDNIEYHARFIESVTITFNSNGGSNVSSQTVAKGTKLSSIPLSTKSGNDFMGWYDTNSNKLTKNTVLNTNMTYTASWEVPSYANTGVEVYYNPVSGSECQSSFSIDGVKNNSSTCYRWRIINENSETVTIQMDHNLVNKLAWYTSNDVTKGPYEALRSLANATANWSKVDDLNYLYDTSAANYKYGTLSCIDGTCTMPGGTVYNVKARLITAEEVVAITRTKTNGSTIADRWTLQNQDRFYFSHKNYRVGTKTSGTGSKELSWLVENTMNSSDVGADKNKYASENRGYWTLTMADSPSWAYVLDQNGMLDTEPTSSTSQWGARPVITVPKALLN